MIRIPSGEFKSRRDSIDKDEFFWQRRADETRRRQNDQPDVLSRIFYPAVRRRKSLDKANHSSTTSRIYIDLSRATVLRTLRKLLEIKLLFSREEMSSTILRK